MGVSSSALAKVLGKQISANGLKGHDLEDWIQNNIGGKGNFKTNNGREIDGILPDGTWYEAKSSFDYLYNPKTGNFDVQNWNKFTSQITHGVSEANKNGTSFKLISNVDPPKRVIDWLNKKGITYEVIR